MELNNKRILIAEDDTPAAHVMQVKLERAGFSVERASDGEQAMEKLKSARYDGMLLDLRMPKKNGFDIIRDVRADPSLADLKILVVSNLGQKEDLEHAMQLGANGYFVKADTNINDLMQKIAVQFGGDPSTSENKN